MYDSRKASKHYTALNELLSLAPLYETFKTFITYKKINYETMHLGVSLYSHKKLTLITRLVPSYRACPDCPKLI